MSSINCSDGIDPSSPVSSNQDEAESGIVELVQNANPWFDRVEGSELANEMANIIKRYCVLTDVDVVASVLWVLASYEISNYRVFPKLAVNSPQKRCGKTTFLEVISALCNRSLLSSNVTSAVLFRVIEDCQPTLIIDEMDTFIDGNDGMRGIINSGHTRKLAFVLRVDGDAKSRKPRRFSTWTPTVLAKIGPFPGTIDDRAIGIKLERKLSNDVCQRIPIDLDEQCYEIRRRCMRWMIDNNQEIQKNSPEILKIGNDRAVDNWLPLLKTAEILGGGWPERASSAMISLETAKGKEDEVEDLPMVLLEDIRRLCKEEHKEGAALTAWLVSCLNTMDERPWPTLRPRGITAHKIASMLKPFGLRSGSRRLPGASQTLKGYSISDLERVFSRYLPEESESVNMTN